MKRVFIIIGLVQLSLGLSLHAANTTVAAAQLCAVKSDTVCDVFEGEADRLECLAMLNTEVDQHLAGPTDCMPPKPGGPEPKGRNWDDLIGLNHIEFCPIDRKAAFEQEFLQQEELSILDFFKKSKISEYAWCPIENTI